MYFDEIVDMVCYVKKIYPEEKHFVSDKKLRVYSAKLWACDTLITECYDNQSINPIEIVESFIGYHEMAINDMEKDDPRRESFSAALVAAYTIRCHLRSVYK